MKRDAENRLKTVTPRNPTPGAKKVAFVYDYMGRRVRKDVFIYNGAWPQDDDPDERWHFVYDGWNVVMMLDGLNSNATTRKYTWGLDLSQSIHGAGGIGGLLATEQPQSVGESTKHWFFYDANGNVGHVLKFVASTSAVTMAAHYEYDPYGNVIVANDVDSSGIVNANPFRFSTKWFDDETGLGNWTFRYYSPRLGRWISRDPAAEAAFQARLWSPGFADLAGLVAAADRVEESNLHSFVANEPLQGYDAVGLVGFDPNEGPVDLNKLTEEEMDYLCVPMCGPDVTDELQALINKVGTVWKGWTKKQQVDACVGLTSMSKDPARGGARAYLMAWDIDMLWRGNQGWINRAPYCPPCAMPQRTCKNTVQVGRAPMQCHYAGSVNYVLFGVMVKTCGWSRSKMEWLIWGYKGGLWPLRKPAENYQPSLDWANAGYDGWPGGAAQTPTGDRPRCRRSCKVDYQGPAFKFYWYPHGWN